MPRTTPVRRRVVHAAIALWIAAALLGAGSRLVTVAAASEGGLFRADAPLGDIRPEQGAAFVASTGDQALSSHERPSTARVLEDGRPLGPGNALHDAIRQRGAGQYSFWHDYVYFSTSDNTDPRSNGRTYTLDYPFVPAAAGRMLWRASLAVATAALVLSVLLLLRLAGSGVGAAIGGLARFGRQVPRLLRSAGGLVQSAAALWVIAAVIGAAASAAFLVRTGTLRAVWPEVAIGTITPEEGLGYVASLNRNDLSSHERPSAARVLEDGQPLGPGNSQHVDIRQEGRGRYSFWYDYVLFSSSDGSDPRTNGRRYAVSYPPVGDALAQALYVLAVLSLVGAILASLAALNARRAAFLSTARAGAGAIGGGVMLAASQAGRYLTRGRPLLTGRAAGVLLLAVAWIAFAALVVADREVHLARTGQSTRLWASAPLQGFVPESGHAFVAATRRPDLSSHVEPSIARVLEDGMPLRSANAQHIDIRNDGQGRYSFWHDYVIFAASDNTDPRTNGRTYTITYPEVGPTEASVLMGLTLLAGLFALAATGLVVRSRIFGNLPVRALKAAWAHRAAVLIAASAAGLLFVPALRAAQWPPALVKVAWVGLFALTCIAGWTSRRAYGTTLVPRGVVLLLVALAGGEGILTAVAPHKWQGCATTEPVPAWDGFCVAPDSASYYFGYQPGSTRNPLYPWFIQALTAGTGFNPSAYRDQAQKGVLTRNDDDPLFPVVKTQIVMLLAASVALAAAAMVATGSLLPPAVLLALYDYGFFTAYELNIVLTEPLVQTGLFLLVAVFLVFLWRPRAVWLISAGALCGLVYLTRQAGAYMVLFLLVMTMWGLVQNWRQFWRPAVGAFALLAALVSIPDLYVFALTGSLTRSQESIQYQYRIAHALQYATTEDLELMPDPATRGWLENAIRLRDIEHRWVEEKYTTDYDRMTYYINQNLYAVAMPTYDPTWVDRLPLAAGGYTRISEFYMAIATPVLVRHWREYLQFAFRFWRLGLSYEPVSRVRFGPLGAWAVYAILGVLALLLRDRVALAAATLIAAHWGHVALASLFAVPIPRMVWASEVLVAVAGMLLLWRFAGAVAAYGRRQQRAEPLPAQEVMA